MTLSLIVGAVVYVVGVMYGARDVARTPKERSLLALGPLMMVSVMIGLTFGMILQRYDIFIMCIGLTFLLFGISSSTNTAELADLNARMRAKGGIWKWIVAEQQYSESFKIKAIMAIVFGAVFLGLGITLYLQYSNVL